MAFVDNANIIFVNRFFYPDQSATSQILTDLAFDLERAGCNVEVVTSRLLYDDTSAALSKFEVVHGVRTHRVWSCRFGRSSLMGRALDYLSFYASAAWRLWKLVDRNSIVVAKTDPPLLSLVAAPVVWLRGGKLVNWLQDIFPEVAGMLGLRIVRGPTEGALRWARNATLRAATTNVVLGNRMKAVVQAQGVRPEQVRVIPNWADGDAIQPIGKDVNPLRKSWGLVGRFVVAYSGNLGRAHDFETVLGASEILRMRSDIVFLFIGGGAQRAAVEKEADSRALPNVLFKPYQPRDRLTESLGVGDVHLVSLNPALEGLIVPSKFCGVAAAGRPTLFVGDGDGEIARVLRDAYCGYTVSNGDSRALAERIVALADDPALCDEMGRNARRVFEDRFERKQAVKAWREVLNDAWTVSRDVV